MTLYTIDNLSWITPSPETSPTYLMNRYRLLREIALPELPAKIHLDKVIRTKEDCETTFGIALDLWKYNIRQPTLTHDVADHFAYIKHTRKFGLILRSAYRMFDNSHEFPGGFGSLLYQMGQVTDTKRGFKPDYPHSVPEMVKMIRESPDTNYQFTPSEPEGFYRQYREVIVTIEQALSKTYLSLDEYHDLRRKRLRHLLNVFQLAGINNMDPEIIGIFGFIHSIDKQIGDQKDCFEELEWSGQEVGPIMISPKIRSQLERFIEIHKSS